MSNEKYDFYSGIPVDLPLARNLNETDALNLDFKTKLLARMARTTSTSSVRPNPDEVETAAELNRVEERLLSLLGTIPANAKSLKKIIGGLDLDRAAKGDLQKEAAELLSTYRVLEAELFFTALAVDVAASQYDESQFNELINPKIVQQLLATQADSFESSFSDRNPSFDSLTDKQRQLTIALLNVFNSFIDITYPDASDYDLSAVLEGLMFIPGSVIVAMYAAIDKSDILETYLEPHYVGMVFRTIALIAKDNARALRVAFNALGGDESTKYANILEFLDALEIEGWTNEDPSFEPIASLSQKFAVTSELFELSKTALVKSGRLGDPLVVKAIELTKVEVFNPSPLLEVFLFAAAMTFIEDVSALEGAARQSPQKCFATIISRIKNVPDVSAYYVYHNYVTSRSVEPNTHYLKWSFALLDAFFKKDALNHNEGSSSCKKAIREVLKDQSFYNSCVSLIEYVRAQRFAGNESFFDIYDSSEPQMAGHPLSRRPSPFFGMNLFRHPTAKYKKAHYLALNKEFVKDLEENGFLRVVEGLFDTYTSSGLLYLNVDSPVFHIFSGALLVSNVDDIRDTCAHEVIFDYNSEIGARLVHSIAVALNPFELITGAHSISSCCMRPFVEGTAANYSAFYPNNPYSTTAYTFVVSDDGDTIESVGSMYLANVLLTPKDSDSENKLLSENGISKKGTSVRYGATQMDLVYAKSGIPSLVYGQTSSADGFEFMRKPSPPKSDSIAAASLLKTLVSGASHITLSVFGKNIFFQTNKDLLSLKNRDFLKIEESTPGSYLDYRPSVNKVIDDQVAPGAIGLRVLQPGGVSGVSRVDFDISYEGSPIIADFQLADGSNVRFDLKWEEFLYVTSFPKGPEFLPFEGEIHFHMPESIKDLGADILYPSWFNGKPLVREGKTLSTRDLLAMRTPQGGAFVHTPEAEYKIEGPNW